MKLNREKLHTKPDKLEQQSISFFEKGTFHWKKDKEEVWAKLEKKLNEKPVTRKILSFKAAYVAAASVLLLIGLFSFMKFYTVSYKTIAGVHQTVFLPDGSKVELNAATQLKFKPYWWKFNRKVALSGEGFFEVAHGSKFTVVSLQAKTEVVGTSFNIFSRDGIYKATCITGKVMVTSKSNKSVLLNPNSIAQVEKSDVINVTQNIDTYPVISWKSNIFLFTAMPVKYVFKEIERQYNVTIKTGLSDISLPYTGNFSKNRRAEEVLGYICPAMGFKLRKLSENVFEITEVN